MLSSAVFEPAELDGFGHLVAAADDDDRDVLADRRQRDELGQITAFSHIDAVEFDDDVARLNSGACRRAFGIRACHERPAHFAEIQAFGERIVDRLDAHAEPAAPCFPVFAQLHR